MASGFTRKPDQWGGRGTSPMAYFAAQTATGVPVLRATAQQNLVIDASGDPRLPHLFSIEGDGAAAQRRRWVVSVNVALDGAQLAHMTWEL